MKTKTLLTLLSISILFAGCNTSTETTVERASVSPSSSIAETESSSESSPDTLAEEKLLSVEVTIPAVFYEEDGEEMTQEKVDQTVSDNGFKSGVLNSDGSVTFSMSKSQHAEFLQSLKDATEETAAGFVDGDDRIESFTKITFNGDLSEFKIYVDSATYTDFDSISALAFYFAGQYYQLFSGVPFENTEVIIDFIDKDTNEVITTGSLSQFRENIQSTDSDSTSLSDGTDEDISSQIEVTGEYFFTNSIDDTYYCLVVKNNSSSDADISVNVLAKDESGSSSGAESASIEAVAPGEEACLTCYLSSTKASSFEYDLTASAAEYYTSADTDLDFQFTDTGKSVVIECENIGTETANSVEAIALFLKDGKMVYYGSTYLVDDDFELKAGKSIAEDIECYEEYDSVKVFVHGYRY